MYSIDHMPEEYKTLRRSKRIWEQKSTQNDIKWGIYYGYPQCCINYFIKSTAPHVRPRHDIHANGFTPCNECAMKVIKKQIKLRDIIHNRQCKYACPQDSMSDSDSDDEDE